MELIYLWIDHYNNIKSTGFNFSSEYNIKFENNEFVIEKSGNKKSDIFDSSFINITGIIGKNGSGKSSLLAYFRFLFSNNIFQHHYYYLIVKNNNELILFTRNHEVPKISSNEKISIENNSELLRDQVALFYYSNTLSIYEDIPFGSDYYDLSTYYNIYRASKESNNNIIANLESAIKDPQNIDLFNFKNQLASYNLPISYYYNSELIKKIEYISENTLEGFDFLPKFIHLNLNFDYIYDQKEILSNNSLILDKAFEVFFNEIDQINNADKKSEFKNQILLFIFIYLINNQLFKETSNKNQDSLIREFNNLVDKNSIIEFIKVNISGGIPMYHSSQFAEIQSFLKELDNLVDKFFYLDIFTQNRFTFYINNELKEFLRKLFKLWEGYKFILHFQWNGLSAGESALITLFSRIYHYSKNLTHFDKTIWLLIDESELLLHPEWQRTIFNNLHTYLPRFFKEKKIQLLLTSHSPFLVSDLPKENILFLDKGLCLKIDKSIIKQTFGANIHSLYANTFFLNTTIGEFAREKINKIIKILDNPEELTLENHKEIQTILEIIGEPIIKSKLEKEYHKRIEKATQIEILEKRIEELRNNDRN